MRALLAHLAFGLADRDALQVRRHEERADPARAFDTGIGARHQREHGGLVRVRDVTLRPVDDVVIALADRRRAQRRGIRPRARLRQTEARNRLPARKLRQPLALLVVAPEHHNALAADADIRPDDGAKRRRGLPKLEANQNLFLHGEPKPAILLRDRHAEEAKLAQIVHDGVGHEIVPRDFVFDRHQPFGHKAADG